MKREGKPVSIYPCLWDLTYRTSSCVLTKFSVKANNILSNKVSIMSRMKHLWLCTTFNLFCKMCRPYHTYQMPKVLILICFTHLVFKFEFLIRRLSRTVSLIFTLITDTYSQRYTNVCQICFLKKKIKISGGGGNVLIFLIFFVRGRGDCFRGCSKTSWCCFGPS